MTTITPPSSPGNRSIVFSPSSSIEHIDRLTTLSHAGKHRFNSSIISLSELPPGDVELTKCQKIGQWFKNIFCCCCRDRVSEQRHDMRAAVADLGLIVTGARGEKSSKSFEAAATSSFDNDITMRFHAIISMHKPEAKKEELQKIELAIQHTPTVNQITALDLSINNLLTIDQILTMMPHFLLLQFLRLPISYINSTQDQETVLSYLVTNKWPRIYCLGVSQASLLQTTAFNDFVQINPLKGLELYNCLGLADNHFHTINSSIKSLRYLNIEACTNVSGDGVEQILQSNPHVAILILNRCKGISTSFHYKIAKAASESLQYLGLYDMSEVNFDVVRAYVTKKPHLKGLDIGRLTLTNEQLTELVTLLPTLETLNLSGCILHTKPEELQIIESLSDFTETNPLKAPIPSAIAVIATQCPHLRHLGLDDLKIAVSGERIEMMPREGLKEVLRQSTHLEYLSLDIKTFNALFVDIDTMELPPLLKNINVSERSTTSAPKPRKQLKWKPITVTDNTSYGFSNTKTASKDPYSFLRIAFRHANDLFGTQMGT